MKLVTVIIPNFNHSLFLEQRIISVLDQTINEYEIIILDDCSSDDSKQIIEKYRNCEKVSNVIFNKVNSGSTFYQWKKGIELAKGEYIWIAESDDFCENNFLEVTSNLLNQNLDVSLVYCKSHRVNEQGDFIDDLFGWYEDLSPSKWENDYKSDGINEIKNSLIYKNTIPNASAVLFRKSKVLDISNEVLSYKLSGDWFFWIKLLEQGGVIYTTSTLNYFRVHKKTVRSTHEKNDTSSIERIRILKYLLSKNYISTNKYGNLTKQSKQISLVDFLKIKVSSLIRFLKSLSKQIS